eukprot:TRINITY_DN12633_c0_g1_i1.p1 TRINITY_DN12633_c0_g1~~TRINITY_DN12633_c0_g1_i1.p1  ORF type:complete len:232 (+),score=27.18 TRINITY_DN12633_c0_g1_i1:26-721(+)
MLSTLSSPGWGAWGTPLNRSCSASRLSLSNARILASETLISRNGLRFYHLELHSDAAVYTHYGLAADGASQSRHERWAFRDSAAAKQLYAALREDKLANSRFRPAQMSNVGSNLTRGEALTLHAAVPLISHISALDKPARPAPATATAPRKAKKRPIPVDYPGANLLLLVNTLRANGLLSADHAAVLKERIIVHGDERLVFVLAAFDLDGDVADAAHSLARLAALCTPKNR